MTGTCADCEFWVVVGDPNEALNECRRFPTPLIKKPSYGCGEFKEKPAKIVTTYLDEPKKKGKK